MANPFYNLTSPELASLRTKYLACLEAIATAGQSYSIDGRSFTRADLDKVKQTIDQITMAQRKKSGKMSRRTFTDFRRF